MDDDKLNIPYISQVYNESPLFSHIHAHPRTNFWIVVIGSEESIMDNSASDELRWHQKRDCTNKITISLT